MKSLQMLVTSAERVRKEQWSDPFESLDSKDKSLWKTIKRVMQVPTSLPTLQMQGELFLTVFEKAEAWSNPAAQYQALYDPSVPAVIEVTDDGMRRYG
jgi:hypothetical protein